MRGLGRLFREAHREHNCCRLAVVRIEFPCGVPLATLVIVAQ
jgi:hypothetical protein